MNAIAALGRRVLLNVFRDWCCNTDAVADSLFHADLAWSKAVCLSDVSGWGAITLDYCGIWPVYWFSTWFADVYHPVDIR